jgi:23S rRNA (cytidine1920-2'-O)/16S rRNA (cytidine1409-2'-O)-methyltransferase
LIPQQASSFMPAKTKPRSLKRRLDILLVERGLVESRQRAQALLLAGQVLVAGQRAEKAGAQVATDAVIEIIGDALPFVSRGGVKLAGALDDFRIAAAEKVCLDVGSSTGGFTDCLLQRGAKRVYAVDVSPEQLAWKLRQDPRVALIERNARYLKAEDIPEPVDLVAVDVSFISVTKILPAIAAVAKVGADFLILIKPQFELERSDVGKGGIVRDPKLHERAIEGVRKAAEQTSLCPLGVRPSHLPGVEGNQEFFLHARRSG